jgi:hypothetical protein
MSKLPGFSGPINHGAQMAVQQTGNAADRIAASLGNAEDAEQAGNVVQGGIGKFTKGPIPDVVNQSGVGSATTKTINGTSTTAYGGNWSGLRPMTAGEIIAAPTRASSFAAKSNALYDRFWSQMNPNTQIPLTNTLQALQGPMDRFPTIPSLGGQITNPRLQSLFQTVAPQTKTTAPILSSLVSQSGNPIVMQAAQKIQSGGSLTVPELQEFRSFIGRSLGEPTLVNDIPRADLSRVYAGMSQDLGNAAQAQGPQAARAFQAANGYYRAGQQRIDQLEPLLSGSPEQTFAKINRAAGTGVSANAGLLRSLQRSLPPDDWNNVGAAVMRQLGTPTAGAKDVVSGVAFSPASFVTNWNKISDTAKDTLFGAAGTPQRDNIEALTRVAGAQKNLSRFGNPSGSAHMGAVVGETSAAVLAAEHYQDFLSHPIATTLALAGGYGAPRLLMSPTVARWLYTLPSTVNQGPTASAGIERALGSLDVLARTDPSLMPVASQLRTALAPPQAQVTQ